MLKLYNELPFPTISFIQGDAYGGGLGLIAASTISIAIKTSKFCFSEGKLGLIPSTISPYVVNKIGENKAREYFTTCERFDAIEANHINLIDHLVNDKEELNNKEEFYIKQFSLIAPNTYNDVNNLLNTIKDRDNIVNKTSELLSLQMQKENAKEGINAFLLKRKPNFK